MHAVLLALFFASISRAADSSSSEEYDQNKHYIYAITTVYADADCTEVVLVSSFPQKNNKYGCTAYTCVKSQSGDTVIYETVGCSDDPGRVPAPSILMTTYASDTCRDDPKRILSYPQGCVPPEVDNSGLNYAFNCITSSSREYVAQYTCSSTCEDRGTSCASRMRVPTNACRDIPSGMKGPNGMDSEAAAAKFECFYAETEGKSERSAATKTIVIVCSASGGVGLALLAFYLVYRANKPTLPLSPSVQGQENSVSDYQKMLQ
eukprot:gb/GEZN01014718.1/.p1 GENE.gb/GEZN01014718.1/~~gb/GEZN01014718.1/.p1  ORF type:complete len:263 (+),score=-2.09 gb/GEZN01014718.1/:52-840(+)